MTFVRKQLTLFFVDISIKQVNPKVYVFFCFKFSLDSRHTANCGIISQHPSAPTLSDRNNVFVVTVLMSQANCLKKFNLLISAQSTVQQSQLNEEFAIEYEEFRVEGLTKLVTEAVMSDGKVTVITLTFHWLGSNYIEG